MLFRFKKNSFSAEPGTPVIQKPCDHKWKGFPMYTDGFVDTDNDEYPWTVYVRTKYVCVKCKEVREETLSTYIYHTETEMQEEVNEFKSKYPDQFADSFIVNSMVLDEQLVDHEFLDAMDHAYQKRKSIIESDLMQLLTTYQK